MNPDPSATGCVFNIQRFSTEDGPGIRTTVFLKGCPLFCPWCHNPESLSPKPQLVWHENRCLGDRACQEACQERALSPSDSGMRIDRRRCNVCAACAEVCPSGALEILGKRMTVDGVMAEVLKDARYYEKSGGGVTFSGGEPTLQDGFLSGLLRASREAGLSTALDTSGQCRPETFAAFLPWVNLVLYDLKSLDREWLKKTTGGNLELIIGNLRQADARGLPIWIRVPVIPHFTGSPENIGSIARFVAAEIPRVERLDLLAFSNLCLPKYDQLGMDFILRGESLLTIEQMEELKETAEQAGARNVVISGPMRKNQSPSSQSQ